MSSQALSPLPKNVITPRANLAIISHYKIGISTGAKILCKELSSNRKKVVFGIQTWRTQNPIDCIFSRQNTTLKVSVCDILFQDGTGSAVKVWTRILSSPFLVGDRCRSRARQRLKKESHKSSVTLLDFSFLLAHFERQSRDIWLPCASSYKTLTQIQ